MGSREYKNTLHVVVKGTHCIVRHIVHMQDYVLFLSCVSGRGFDRRDIIALKQHLPLFLVSRDLSHVVVRVHAYLGFIINTFCTCGCCIRECFPPAEAEAEPGWRANRGRERCCGGSSVDPGGYELVD